MRPRQGSVRKRPADHIFEFLPPPTAMPLPSGPLMTSAEVQNNVSTRVQKAMEELAAKGEAQRQAKAMKEIKAKAEEQGARNSD